MSDLPSVETITHIHQGKGKLFEGFIFTGNIVC